MHDRQSFLRAVPLALVPLMLAAGGPTAAVAGALTLTLETPGGAERRRAGAAGVQPDSERLARAKDLMAEEQWVAAMTVLRAAVADPKETGKDEALFWLAHSQNQAGDLAEAVGTVRRLQRDHSSSRWSRPAYSLLIELAQKLGREDVLWWTAAPHRPASPSARPVPAPAPRVAPSPRPSTRAPARVPAVAPRPAVPLPPAVPPAPAVSPTPAIAPPFASWMSEAMPPDADLRVQALGSLIHTDADKAIPMLRSIALQAENPGVARRALFVLAQSRNPDARTTVVEVARHGTEGLRIAAVRELGRFGGPEAAVELLQVYRTSNLPVKRQVVVSLGERLDVTSLMKIAQSEADRHLRDVAIVTLGRAGGREHLRGLYGRAREARLAVIAGLFNARDEEGLIRIAKREKDARLRGEALSRLRLMGTPRAKAYLEKVSSP